MYYRVSSTYEIAEVLNTERDADNQMGKRRFRTAMQYCIRSDTGVVRHYQGSTGFTLGILPNHDANSQGSQFTGGYVRRLLPHYW